MRGMERIARLVAMVCIAPVWAYLVGELFGTVSIKMETEAGDIYEETIN